MKNTLLTVLISFLLVPAISLATNPILNLHSVPVPIKVDGTRHTAQEVRTIIIEGCLARGWLPVLDGEGMVRATIDVRGRHFAEIEIPYTSAAYSVLYLSSTNLDYEENRQRIHRNYNNWVQKLSATINRIFRDASRNVTSTPSEQRADTPMDGPSTDLYSEILKLDDLRDRGILTDEEFEAEKKELLDAN